MKSQNLGCLSINALVSMVISLAVIGFFVLTTGHAMFSPGQLNAQTSGTNLGGVTSHAEIGSDCAACHAAIWDPAGMTDHCQDCHTDLIKEKMTFML